MWMYRSDKQERQEREHVIHNLGWVCRRRYERCAHRCTAPDEMMR